MKTQPSRLWPFAVLSLILAFSSAVQAKKVDRRPTLAVLYFTYDGPDAQLAMLKKGLAEMLIADFAELDSIRVVERSKLEAILKELKLNQTRKIDRRTASRIGKILGAKYMVLGHYFHQLGQLCVIAKLAEVETTRILPSAKHCAPAPQFLQIQQHISERLKKVISTKLEAFTKRRRAAKGRAAKTVKRGGVGGPKARARAPRRLTMKMAVRYAKALDARDQGNTKKARALLKKIVKEQPDFRLAALELKKLDKRVQ